MIRVALLTKDNCMGLIGLRPTEYGAMLLMLDGRNSNLSTSAQHDTVTAADNYRGTIANSKFNGWTLFYDGPPMWG